jgi:ribosomal protein L9
MKAFWFWLFALFGKKPKALPPYEEALLVSFQKAKKELRKQAGKWEKEEQRCRENKEREERKKREAMAKLEADGAKPADVKRAFGHIGKVLATEAMINIHINRNTMKMTRDQFKAFQKSFVKLCRTMGLEVEMDDDWISIPWNNAIAYKDRLGKQTSKSTHTSAYR